MPRIAWLVAACGTVVFLVALRFGSPGLATAAGSLPADSPATGRTVEQAARVTRTYESTNFRIDYVNDFVNEPEHSITDAQAQLLAFDFEAARLIMVDTWGFRAPLTTRVPGKTLVTVNSDGGNRAGGYSHGGWIELLPITQVVRSSLAEPRSDAPPHELFHEIQRAYAPPVIGENWIFEGTARLVEDQLFSSWDLDPESSYMHSIELYLDLADFQYFDDFGVLRSGLLGSWYDAALFWKYFAEKTGDSPTTEPGYRINAIKAFYEARALAPAMASVEAAALALGHPTTFEQLFRDFTLANYTKDLTYDPRFAYWDDNDTPYQHVYTRTSTLIPAGPTVSYPNEHFGEWSVRHYEMIAGAGCLYLQVEATPTSGNDSFFHLISRLGQRVVGVQTILDGGINRTYWANAGSQITSVGISAGSEALPLTYTLSARCITPSLRVLGPNSGYVAYGGDPANPDNFLVELEVLADNEPVTGLDSTAFTVTVGGRPAQIISSASVQDQYWLVVKAPTQPTTATYSMTVALNGLPSQTMRNSVRYGARASADQILVIDNSGSMADEDKLAAARNAANLFIDLAAADDKIGVVTFSNTSRLSLPLVPGNPAGKVLAFLATGLMQSNGLTCIGCGAEAAQNELNTRGVAGHFQNIILLSDGMQTTGQTWNDVRGAITPTETVIDTVFLGPADAEAEFLMQRIAKETGGTYTRVFLDSEGIETSSARTAQAAPLQLELENRLANVYKGVREGVERHERFFEKSGKFPTNGDRETISVTMQLSELMVAVNWNLGQANPVLQRPNGTIVNPGDPDVMAASAWTTNVTYRLSNPATGTYTITFVNPQGDLEYLIAASGRGSTSFFPILGLPIERRIVGRDMPLLAVVADSTPITGATVRAVVQGPDPRLNMTVRLRDDGRHGDGEANDGVYGGTYPFTRLAGSYRVDFRASGVNHAGEAFTLYEDRSFYMLGFPDTDGDGIGPIWEIIWGFNPNESDGLLDPDDDGLTNFEEFQRGTNPLNYDTDGGGESDGSEVRGRRDPLDPDDDGARRPRWLFALAGNRRVTVTYELPPGAPGGILYRVPVSGPVAMGSLAAVDSVTFSVGTSGVFTDTTVQNGVTYRYHLVALGAGGAQSGPSVSQMARPSAAIVPPPSGPPTFPPYRRFAPFTSVGR
ncbi:MAG: VWA domain-containing protein [Dehalococcoidia bacterium]